MQDLLNGQNISDRTSQMWQPSSSDLSSQSEIPLQNKEYGMQRPLAHLNSDMSQKARSRIKKKMMKIGAHKPFLIHFNSPI